MSDTAPAGWYPDGQTADHERYWDGAQWTQQYRRVGDATPPPPPGPYDTAYGAYAAPEATPVAAQPRTPSGFGVSLRQSLRNARLLLAGDPGQAVQDSASIAERGGSRLYVWLIPAALNAILVGFWAIALVAAPVGVAKEQLGSAFGAPGSLGGSIGSALGGAISTSSMGGALTGAYFVGLAVGFGFILLRAVALVLTASTRGGRLRFTDALVVVGASHALTPVGWVLATVFLAIPGYAGLILFLIVEILVGLPLLLLAEQSVSIGAARLTQFGRSPVFVAALFGGLSYAITYAVALLVLWQLMLAGVNSLVGGLGSLGSLGGMFG